MSAQAMQLKAKIRNLSKEKKIPAQVLLQNYMFERFLIRLSQSNYQNNFIIKGGMLVASIVGLAHRATMDLDTTLKNMPLKPDVLKSAIEQIASIPLEDGISFSVGQLSPIREDDLYGGYRLALIATYETIVTPLSIDISTGDTITPSAEQHVFHEMFNEVKQFSLWAYNIETILAEKIETILRRNVFNTRPRDFYDAYILLRTQSYDKEIFLQALRATAEHRKTVDEIADVETKLTLIATSNELQQMWQKYQNQFDYAKDIPYSDIMASLHLVLSEQGIPSQPTNTSI